MTVCIFIRRRKSDVSDDGDAADDPHQRQYAATGMPDGRYTLGGLDVDVVGNRATLVSDGALAGSATNLMDCCGRW